MLLMLSLLLRATQDTRTVDIKKFPIRMTNHRTRTHAHTPVNVHIRMQPSLSLIIAQRKLCLSVSNNENTHCSIEYEGKWLGKWLAKWLAVGINSTTLINSKLSPK